MKSAAEIRTYLLARLQCALLRPGMCGGELGILNLMEYVTFIDERSMEWQHRRKELHERKCFNAGGVTGGFRQVLGFRQNGEHDDGVASVYARIAIQMGYLSTEGEDRMNRLLTVGEFDSLESQWHKFVEMEKCVPDDVISRFGVPSIRWGTNDYYPCTLLYLCESAPTRYVHFDFWAEWYKNADGLHVPCKFGTKPLLRNIRIPAETFAEEFVFTTFGSDLLKEKRKTTDAKDH
ncbi:MAG: hypothetical protein R3C03_19475 [Pirellulaceae bacterium]